MWALISRWTVPPLLVLAMLAAVRLVVVGQRQPAIVVPGKAPLVIAPLQNDPRVITDEQLALVLSRVVPPARPVNTNNFIHALRLWGPCAEFDSPAALSSASLQSYFLDDAAFQRLAREGTPPILYRSACSSSSRPSNTSAGRAERFSQWVDVRSFDDRPDFRETSSYHTDDLLATLAEIGTPLETTLQLRDGHATVEDLLYTALHRFHLERLEVEWTTIAYARYVFPQIAWRNQYGEQIDAHRLVTRLVSQPPELGPCNGLHRLEALVVLYRADEQFPALRPKTRRAALAYMQDASRQLVAAQSSEGYWTRQWPEGSAALHTPADENTTNYDKLLVTGHHLEWLALAPNEVQPPRETIIRAAQWLARTLVEMDEKELLEAYGPYTHAARALCLWRGTEAWEAWQRVHRMSPSRALAVTGQGSEH